MSVRCRLAVATAVLALAAPLHATAKSAKLQVAYVVLGSEGPVARAVYKDAKSCPSITLNGTAQAMNIRALPETATKKKKPAFPVLVCELLIPAGTTTATLASTALPLPPVSLGSVAMIGDTGCRPQGRQGSQSEGQRLRGGRKIPGLRPSC
jgi:hypothetical protein